eukprot:gene5584-3993_t
MDVLILEHVLLPTMSRYLLTDATRVKSRPKKGRGGKRRSSLKEEWEEPEDEDILCIVPVTGTPVEAHGMKSPSPSAKAKGKANGSQHSSKVSREREALRVEALQEWILIHRTLGDTYSMYYDEAIVACYLLLFGISDAPVVVVGPRVPRMKDDPPSVARLHAKTMYQTSHAPALTFVQALETPQTTANVTSTKAATVAAFWMTAFGDAVTADMLEAFVHQLVRQVLDDEGDFRFLHKSSQILWTLLAGIMDVVQAMLAMTEAVPTLPTQARSQPAPKRGANKRQKKDDASSAVTTRPRSLEEVHDSFGGLVRQMQDRVKDLGFTDELQRDDEREEGEGKDAEVGESALHEGNDDAADNDSEAPSTPIVSMKKMSSKEESPTKQRTPAPSTAETSAPLAISSSSQANSNGASSSTNGFAPVVSTLEYSGIAYGSNDYSVANATSTSSSQKILVESEFLFGHNVKKMILVESEFLFGHNVKKMVKISGPSITVERIISSVVESCQLTQSPEQLLFTFHDPEVEEFVVLDEFSLADFLQLPKKIIHLQSVAPLIPGGASPEKKESTTPSRLASKSDEQETTSASTDVTVSPPINKADKPLVARAHVLQLITFLGVHSNLSHRETRDMLLSAGTYGFVNFLVRLSLSQSRANDAAGDSSSCINATASRWKITAEFPPIGSRVLSLNGVFVNDLERNQQITLLKQRRRPFVIEFEVFDPPITDTHRPNPPTIKFALFYSKYTSSYASKLRKQIDKILEDYETCDWADAKRQGTGSPQATIVSLYKYIEQELQRLDLFNPKRSRGDGFPPDMKDVHWHAVRTHIEAMIFKRIVTPTKQLFTLYQEPMDTIDPSDEEYEGNLFLINKRLDPPPSGHEPVLPRALPRIQHHGPHEEVAPTDPLTAVASSSSSSSQQDASVPVDAHMHLELSTEHGLNMKLAYLRFVTLEILGVHHVGSAHHEQPPPLERQSSGDDSGGGCPDKSAKLASMYPPDMASIDRILSERNQIVFQEEWYQAIRGLHQLSMLETPGEMTQRLKLVVDLITRALEKYINRPPSLLLDPQSTMAHAQQAREQDLLTCSACKQVHLANGDNETISIPEPLSASTVRQWNDTYGYVNAAVWCPGSDEAAAQPKHITGDDLLPGLVFALIQANPPNIDCLLWLCAEFRHPSLHVGEEAYCLATVSSALEFVRRARYQSVDVIPHILYDHFMLRYTYTLKLMLACKDGDLRQVQRLVENGADVNGLSPDQLDSPLTACVRYNQPRILYYLLFEQHTTVVHVDAVVHLYRGPHERSTALHIATKQGEVEMVLMLLAAGANRYIADEEGRTPLSIAMEAEQEHLQELVTSESPPSIQYLAMYSSPYALLHTILLADSPRIDVVDMILRKDPVAERFGYAAAGDEDSFSITTHLFGGVATSAAALDTTTDFTSTAIEALVREVVMPRESLALVLQSLLLQDPAAGSTAPIYQCTRHHDYASVRALLLQAVDVNVVCPTKGYSPLIAAVYNRDVKMIQLLLHTGRGGMTALHYAAQLGLTTVVGLLLARGAQRGIANLQQHTAVDVAVANGHMDTANVLRFDPHKISLCLAAKHGDWLVMKALLLQGISINVVKEHVHPQKGRHYELDTPLIAAVSHGQYELVKKLLTELPTYAAGSSSGSGPVADTAADDDMMIFPQVLDVNQVNTIGQSALMYAAARGEENIVLLLLKHGADRYVKDTAGHDAVHWAMAQNHSQLATILRHDPDLIYVHDLIRKNDFEAVVAMFKQGVDVNLRRERLLVNLSHPTVVAAREEALPVPPVVPASASHAAGASAAAAATGTTGAAGPSSSSLSSTASSIASTATSSLFTYHHGRRLSAPTVARLEALQEFARMFIPGETPLIVAARYARMDVLQLLFKAPNVDIDAIEDTNGWSALFYAAEQGQEEVVKFLLAKKANRKLEDCLGRCARDIALLHHHEVIAAMIDADPYHVHIHDTCQHGLLMLTIGLLKQGCPPTFRDERPGMHRQTPLMAAASGGQVDIMRMLLRYPAVYDGKDDRDALGRTALMRAAAVGALDATAVLLNAGCDRSLQDQQGLTARDHAARHSFSVMFQFMSQSMVR